MTTIMRPLYLRMLVVVVGLSLSGCVTPVTPPPAKRQAAFVESEFAPYAGTGTSTITGQAFLKTRSGELRFGAGCEVVMVPVTPYTTETGERAVLRNERLEAPDPRYAAYRRTTIADGNGNFEFRNIPAGSYYLSCDIRWEYATQYGLSATGGTAFGKTTVAAGATTKVIVTR